MLLWFRIPLQTSEQFVWEVETMYVMFVTMLVYRQRQVNAMRLNAYS